MQVGGICGERLNCSGDNPRSLVKFIIVPNEEHPMDGTEQEQFHDDVEITDLPEEIGAAGRLRTSRGGAGLSPPLLVEWPFRRLTPR